MKRNVNDCGRGSVFKGKIVIGMDYDWQSVVNYIRAFATLNECDDVIIYTGVIDHQINVTHRHNYKEYLANHDGKTPVMDYQTALQSLEIIATPIDKLEDAILRYQQLPMVKLAYESRCYAGPHFAYSRRFNCSDPDMVNMDGELRVRLSWDS